MKYENIEGYYTDTDPVLDKKALLNGKIVAECDFEVEKLTNCGTSFMIMKYDDLQESYRYTNKIARGSCLNYTDLRRYLGTKDGYAIHIKNLHIFDEPKEEAIIFKNKVDIEKELFDEFNSGIEPEYKLDMNTSNKNMEETGERELPEVSIDEYMKNFNEDEFKENEINSLFSEDDMFPTIPL
jgi:hypothetical protein